VDHFGRLHIVEAITDFLDGGDEGLRADHFGIEDHERGVYFPVGVELDVSAGHAREVIQFLPDLGHARDFTHHAGDGQLGDSFFHGAGAVDVPHGDITLGTARDEHHTEGEAHGEGAGEGDRGSREVHGDGRNSRTIYLRSFNPDGPGLLTSAMPASSSSPSAGQILVLVLLAAIWGSSFILMKIGLFGWGGGPGSPAVLDGLQLGLLRIAVAGLVLAPVAFRRARRWDRGIWTALAVNGFIGSLLPAILFAHAQTRLPSATAGMLNALSPLWTLVIALVVYGTSVRRKQAGGLLLGFAGAVGLMSLRDGTGEVHWLPAAMVVLATAGYGLSINVVRNRLAEVGPVTISAVALSMTAVPSAVGFFLLGGSGAVADHPEGFTALAAVVVLACIGTAGALMLFNRLIQRTDALFASSVTYVIPLFALMWGWLDGEAIGWLHAVYGAVILSGVRLVARG